MELLHFSGQICVPIVVTFCHEEKIVALIQQNAVLKLLFLYALSNYVQYIEFILICQQRFQILLISNYISSIKFFCFPIAATGLYQSLEIKKAAPPFRVELTFLCYRST